MCNVAHNSRARRRFFCVLFLYAQPTCNDLALFNEVHRVQMRTDMRSVGVTEGKLHQALVLVSLSSRSFIINVIPKWLHFPFTLLSFPLQAYNCTGFKRPWPGDLFFFATLNLKRNMTRVGQNHIYTVYIHGIFGREITKYTVIYGVYIYNSGQP